MRTGEVGGKSTLILQKKFGDTVVIISMPSGIFPNLSAICRRSSFIKDILYDVHRKPEARTL